ncbi:endopolygalacturonase [Paenibacillus odorifer]|jgi:polygalacturonase|uniref:glycoside hydrolase family 28 protein n=1 Tax=Paenibacillus TaxID=44249 RepID=UPI00096D3ACB|nr:glycoside hydrolase family 28 protein [Paenibacillus odorifer]OMD59705.1 endopolygalacturonase [Paenibacillus odorifer]OMD80217.1 endopolygalacturonase [Paenibacillus odorifer]OMD85193.1 endopolygalacturonase [Paenibacillus odorifer]OMD90606.1 endopolygalacturonase [Paenibacillus odorifer]OMD94491.1 endopolygalacturonase [Paenibacillus odorifer]
MLIYNIEDFGALKNSKKLATEAITRAIEAANKAGGGTVYVPAGTFLTGAIHMKSNIELNLNPGAILSFSTNPEDYPAVECRWEGVKQQVHSPCIYGRELVNVSITGSGMINGNGELWWDKFRNRREELQYPRPTLIGLDSCQRVTLKDIALVNSPSWTVNPIGCYNVTIDNISILNPADSPNTDGINPESCTNVRISNCNIDVGDDCIAIKAGTEDTKERVPCENITITNCTMVHGHGGVVLGSEMSGDIRNVTISNCVFKQTDRGIRMKSRRGRGGTIEDIRISNIVMEDVICPFTLNLYYFCGPRGKEKYVWDKNPYPITEETPCFRRIHFANITARNVHAAAGFLYGLAEQYVSEITFTNVDISMATNAIPGHPDMMTGIENMNNRGFFLGNARDVQFHQVTIENHEGPAFYIENGEAVEIINCRSKNTKKPEKLVEQATVSPEAQNVCP